MENAEDLERITSVLDDVAYAMRFVFNDRLAAQRNIMQVFSEETLFKIRAILEILRQENDQRLTPLIQELCQFEKMDWKSFVIYLIVHDATSFSEIASVFETFKF